VCVCVRARVWPWVFLGCWLEDLCSSGVCAVACASDTDCHAARTLALSTHTPSPPPSPPRPTARCALTRSCRPGRLASAREALAAAKQVAAGKEAEIARVQQEIAAQQ
jgi:hypothetical protein